MPVCAVYAIAGGPGRPSPRTGDQAPDAHTLAARARYRTERPAASLIHPARIRPGTRAVSASRRLARADTPVGGTVWTRRSPAGVRTGKVTRVNRNDEELAVLRDRHPGWQIWRVD